MQGETPDSVIEIKKSLRVPNEFIREFQGSCGMNLRVESRIQKKLNIATNDLKRDLDDTERFLSEKQGISRCEQ